MWLIGGVIVMAMAVSLMAALLVEYFLTRREDPFWGGGEKVDGAESKDRDSE